jgi:adenine/guanine phosphoribosyltransferase-like PRPP-binding protein
VQGAGVRDQAGLDAAQRVANTTGRLRIRRSSTIVRRLGISPPGLRQTPGEWVVVVDDIVTTGASIAAAVSALSAAGVGVAGAATVAWTPRRWGGTSDPH